jgi:hypothetical protein
MKVPMLFAAVLLLEIGGISHAQQPAAAPATSSPAPALASFAQRAAAAKSVQVLTSILGVELGLSLADAHQKLDAISDPATLPKARHQKLGGLSENDDEIKALWTLTGTDYRAVYIKADDKERITSITGFLRTGKELPFDKIGEVEKAPIHTETGVAWDLLRPEHPLSRVVASGADGKASSIVIFVVPRPELDLASGPPSPTAQR